MREVIKLDSVDGDVCTPVGPKDMLSSVALINAAGEPVRSEDEKEENTLTRFPQSHG